MKYKNYCLAFLAFVIVVSTGFASGTFEISASRLFKYNADYKSKINNIQGVVQPSSTPVSFIINNDLAGSIFLSDYNKIKINDFIISDGLKKNLILFPVNPSVSSETKFFKSAGNGLEQVQGPYVASFSGFIEGEQGTTVFLNYWNGKVWGFIEGSDKNKFTFSPDISTNNREGYHLVVNNDIETDHSDVNPFVCLTNDYSGDAFEKEDLAKYGDVPLANSKVLQVSILCEGSYDYYTLMGSNYDFAAAYMTSVINLSSKIYEDNINVHLVVYKIVIRTDANSDPYKSASDLSDKLMIMPDVWTNTEPNRALVVLFADLNDQPAGTIVAGISMGGQPYVGSLCNKNWGYCALGIRGGYTYPTLNYTWDINVATHEIGHNFSAPHTHACYYRPNMIDTCVTQSQPFPVGDACIKTGNAIPRPGTIMSYCHTTNATHSVELVFHERTKPLMRKAAETSACVAEAPGNFLSLLHPLGDSSYMAGKTMEIRWTSKNVKSVNLYYTLDSGNTWTTIEKQVDASDSIYIWNIPNVTSYKAKVAISDASNEALNDKSLTVFYIIKGGITIVAPLKGERIGFNDKYIIKWKMTFPNKSKIEFSSNAGTDWSLISGSDESGSLSWIVPSIPSENCRIRITDLNDSSITATSGDFAIGKSWATLIYPTNGSVFCANDFNDIKWKSDFVNNMMMEYTTDGGTVWKKVTPIPISGSVGGYTWKTPSIFTHNAKIRLFTFISSVVTYLDSTKQVFDIDSCSTVVSDQKSDMNKFIKITEVVPNPVKCDAKIDIINNSDIPVNARLLLIDEAGNIVAVIFDSQIINTGENNFSFKTDKISQGSYILSLNFDKGSVTFPIKIVR